MMTMSLQRLFEAINQVKDEPDLRFGEADTLRTHFAPKQERVFCRQAIRNLLFRPALARTMADLAGDNDLKTNHLAEAIQYRTIDRMQ